MGVSTDGIIAYGVIFDDGHEFPWDSPKYEGEIELWWADYHDMWDVVLNSPKEFRAWIKGTPPPFEKVNYCSARYPMWLVAMPGTVTECRRGDPTEFTPSDLRVEPERAASFAAALILFGVDPHPLPRWYLMSRWG